MDYSDINTLEKAIASWAKISDQVFDKAYRVAKERGDNMDIWFRVGHDQSAAHATLKFVFNKYKESLNAT